MAPVSKRSLYKSDSQPKMDSSNYKVSPNPRTIEALNSTKAKDFSNVFDTYDMDYIENLVRELHTEDPLSIQICVENINSLYIRIPHIFFLNAGLIQGLVHAIKIIESPRSKTVVFNLLASISSLDLGNDYGLCDESFLGVAYESLRKFIPERSESLILLFNNLLAEESLRYPLTRAMFQTKFHEIIMDLINDLEMRLHEDDSSFNKKTKKDARKLQIEVQKLIYRYMESIERENYYEMLFILDYSLVCLESQFEKVRFGATEIFLIAFQESIILDMYMEKGFYEILMKTIRMSGSESIHSVFNCLTYIYNHKPDTVVIDKSLLNICIHHASSSSPVDIESVFDFLITITPDYADFIMSEGILDTFMADMFYEQFFAKKKIIMFSMRFFEYALNTEGLCGQIVRIYDCLVEIFPTLNNEEIIDILDCINIQINKNINYIHALSNSNQMRDIIHDLANHENHKISIIAINIIKYITEFFDSSTL